MPDNLIYSNDTTLNHPIAHTHPASVISFNEAVTKENSNRTCTLFDSTWRVIDLDAVEAQLASQQRRNRNSTCDNAVGVLISETPGILLVEYKLNVQHSCDNIKEQDLRAKISGSISLLGQVPAICRSSYFVFPDRLINTAINRLRRFNANRRGYVAVTLQQLKDILSR